MIKKFIEIENNEFKLNVTNKTTKKLAIIYDKFNGCLHGYGIPELIKEKYETYTMAYTKVNPDLVSDLIYLEFSDSVDKTIIASLLNWWINTTPGEEVISILNDKVNFEHKIRALKEIGY